MVSLLYKVRGVSTGTVFKMSFAIWKKLIILDELYTMYEN